MTMKVDMVAWTRALVRSRFLRLNIASMESQRDAAMERAYLWQYAYRGGASQSVRAARSLNWRILQDRRTLASVQADIRSMRPEVLRVFNCRTGYRDVYTNGRIYYGEDTAQ
mgnify:CR=1 FL=1